MTSKPEPGGYGEVREVTSQHLLASTRRQRSALYEGSSQNGLHALIVQARHFAKPDRILYQGMALCLDALTTSERLDH